jgi:hypothetical protein
MAQSFLERPGISEVPGGFQVPGRCHAVKGLLILPVPPSIQSHPPYKREDISRRFMSQQCRALPV